jgi:hypothetical protein
MEEELELLLDDLHGRDEEHDSLRIFECLEELGPLPFGVGGDGLILPNSFNGDALLTLSKPSGVGLIVRHQIEDEQGVDKADTAEEQEEDLPCWE